MLIQEFGVLPVKEFPVWTTVAVLLVAFTEVTMPVWPLEDPEEPQVLYPPPTLKIPGALGVLEMVRPYLFARLATKSLPLPEVDFAYAAPKVQLDRR